MTIGALYPPATALAAFGTGLQSTAHNLANVLTDNFKAGRVTYRELPALAGTGAEGPTPLAAGGPARPYGPGLPPPDETDPARPTGFVEGSTTDVVTEMVNLVVTSRSYQANAKTIRAADEMLGTVINLKV